MTKKLHATSLNPYSLSSSFQGIPAKTQFENILRICGRDPSVQEAVRKNLSDNLWWPRGVDDWRMRMLIAGLSSRISYAAIDSYRSVISRLNALGFDHIKELRECEFASLVSPLGLKQQRIRLWRSTVSFARNNAATIDDCSTEELVSLIQQEVDGASWHLAQCCALYIRGYDCGIVPVDSGMRDVLAPCIGLCSPRTAEGFEIVRKQIEYMIRTSDVRAVAAECDYDLLADGSWWTHLNLIYFKRFFCNKKNPDTCPLRAAGLVTGMACSPQAAFPGGIRTLLLEGPDGVGKSSVARLMQKLGFKVIHSDYHKSCDNLERHYQSLVNTPSTNRRVFDRCFISEAVYGPVLRSKDRLSPGALRRLCSVYSTMGSSAVFLSASRHSTLKRCKSRADRAMLESHYEELALRYRRVEDTVAKLMPTLHICTDDMKPNEIVSRILGIPEATWLLT